MAQIFGNPTAFEIENIGARSLWFESNGRKLSSLTLLLESHGDIGSVVIIGSASVGDRFQRVAAAITEIFASEAESR